MQNRKLTTGKVDGYRSKSPQYVDSQTSFVDSIEAQDDINSSHNEDLYLPGFDVNTSSIPK